MLNSIGVDMSFDRLKVFSLSGSQIIDSRRTPSNSVFDQVVFNFSSCVNAYVEESGAAYSSLVVNVGLPAELIARHKKEIIKGLLDDCLMRWGAISSVKVVSHASASLYDMIYNVNGSKSKEVVYATKNVGVVSVESNRIELSGILFGKAAPMMMVSEHCRDRIYADNYIADYIDAAWGKTVKLLDRVIVSGADAEMVKQSLTPMFGDKLWVPSDPLLSAARGLYKNVLLPVNSR